MGCGGDSTGTSGGYYLRFQTPSGQVNFTSQASLQAAFSQSGNQYLMVVTGGQREQHLHRHDTVNQTVTITSLTSTGVMGQFSGVLKAAGQPDLVVSNGQFSVNRAN